MSHRLIGRHSERQRLLDLLASAAGRQPVVVLLESEAGVGKTSLLEWFADEAQERRALVLSGACIELGGGGAIPYAPLTEALRLFVRREGWDQARRLAGPAWSTLGALIADPNVTAQAMAPAAGSQARIFGAVLRISDQLERRAPLVLIFEDLHWADASTLDLIRYVVRAKTDQRLMLVCSYRPVAVRHPLRELLGEQDFRRRVHSIGLAPFSRADLDQFVAELSGWSVPQERLNRYFELSEGNAYFAEQLVMTDQPESPEVEVPQSLREVMMVRLAHLSDEATEVVRVAAVAGRRIGDNLLAAVSGLDDRALEAALVECERLRILLIDAGDDAYAFQHALLRDTAYRDLMLPRTRKRLHGLIAKALEDEPGAQSRLVPELAYHWFEAGRLPEAFTASLRAAGQAVRMYAFPEALMQYERALALWPDIANATSLFGAQRQRLLGLAADTARWANRVSRALECVREAIAEVDPVADPGRAGELQERLGSYLWEAGEYDGAAEAYARADRLLTGLPPSAVASRVQSALGTAATRMGDYAGALERARSAVDLARAVGALAEEGRALNSLGLALAFSGDADAGEEALRKALETAAKADHLEDLFRAYGNLGVCLEQAGRLADAVAAMHEGLARAKEHGLLGTRQSGVLATNAAAALFLLGRYAEAEELLDQVVLHRPVAESLYGRLTRAEIHVGRGEFADAEQLLGEIGERSSKDPRFIGPLYACRAEAAAWQGHHDHARAMVLAGMERTAEATSARVAVQLRAVGLRIAADTSDPAWADDLVAAVPPLTVGPPGHDETVLLTRQCHAEHARASKQDTPESWAEIVEGWAAVQQPWRTAYAQGRLAAACARIRSREQATSVLRLAYASAETIGAEPLRAQLEALGRQLRLRMGEPQPFSLTAMELKVLAKLASGATNADIAAALGISANTVGVHVSNILRKMGVRNRSEAAALARSEGITG
ncbi:ATP-binding protein [Allorhizocola rhizosphaerae]|uniref:ATP-binding protein n=1 Tax=Allorhizocola rhizosphaerae TaxID=1872709 RepID=UPI0013C367AE|nr:AAA family ATPase [Allorhizocola rhizosphaerae]